MEPEPYIELSEYVIVLMAIVALLLRPRARLLSLFALQQANVGNNCTGQSKEKSRAMYKIPDADHARQNVGARLRDFDGHCGPLQ